MNSSRSSSLGQRHREGSTSAFCRIERDLWHRNAEARCLRGDPVRAHCAPQPPFRLLLRLPLRFLEKANMTAATSALSHRLRPMLAAISIGAAAALVSQPALARGPEGIADVAEKVIDAVVNISTSQTIEAKSDGRS